MGNYTSLEEFLRKNPPTIDRICYDGAVRNPNKFPLYGISVTGAILFADLPGYSRYALDASPEECAFMINHFFAWIEAEAIRHFGGIVDKFIGDEIMLVFAPEFSELAPLEAALRTAKAILEHDTFDFAPKIGIAHGDFMVATVGTRERFDVSVVGHPVNIAARCIGSAKSQDIKVADPDMELINQVFSEELVWHIEGPVREELKNVGEVDLTTIHRQTMRILSFDYYEMVKQAVANAKKSPISD